MNAYQLSVLALQETHMGGDITEDIKDMAGKERYTIYHSKEGDKSQAGTAIAVTKGTRANFRAISDRLCMLTIKTNKNYTITVINAYAPTLPVSENDPDIRERFYDELESVVRSVSKRDFLVIAGDFNAKTGQEWNTYPENMGRYGKGQVNSNGRELLEFCNQQDLILTNTLFRHKMATAQHGRAQPPTLKGEETHTEILLTM